VPPFARPREEEEDKVKERYVLELSITVIGQRARLLICTRRQIRVKWDLEDIELPKMDQKVVLYVLQVFI
jgi:hypothetical protein